MTGDPMKYMDLAEFRSAGYLVEVNRRVLHPLGLALALEQDRAGVVRFLGVLDSRDDPEGVHYVPVARVAAKAANVAGEEARRRPLRGAALGFWVQPLTGDDLGLEREPMVPRIADLVHYVAYGTPGGEYPMACRAAVVTEVGPGSDLVESPTVGLCVLNPTGVFFNRSVPYFSLLGCDPAHGGTWHHPSECGPGPGLGSS